MILIAHRGNVNQIIPDRENHPDYIDKAITQGYDVEMDVRLIDGKLLLGHDTPDYEVSLQWFRDRNSWLWVHCKNFAALEYLVEEDYLRIFYHQKENHTIINGCNLIWSHELSEAGRLSIIPLLSEKDLESYSLYSDKVYGVCSDFVERVRHQ